MTVDEKLVTMSLKTSANIVRVILLKILVEGNVQTAQILNVHEDSLPEWMGGWINVIRQDAG